MSDKLCFENSNEIWDGKQMISVKDTDPLAHDLGTQDPDTCTTLPKESE